MKRRALTVCAAAIFAAGLTLAVGGDATEESEPVVVYSTVYTLELRQQWTP
jgi:hypothetical protein